MFKSKRHKGTIRKTEKEESDDNGVEIDIELLKMEQKLRNEAKCGVSTEELIKQSTVEVIDGDDSNVDEDITSNPLDYVIKQNKKKEESKKQQDEEKLKKYIYDDSLIYQPDGITIQAINPKPIVSSNDRKEIEEAKDGHKETIEELIELKKKLTRDLKRERRIEREKSGLL